MFRNIGKKLKTVAKVVCWIGIIASVVMGVILIIAGSNGSNTIDYYGNIAISTQGTNNVVAGIIVIVVGSLSSWVGSLLIYGFGQLIEDNSEMRKIMERA